jgi:hypothetical protein
MAIAYNTSIVRDGLVLYLDAANPKSYPGSGATINNLIKNNVTAQLVGSYSFSNGQIRIDNSSLTAISNTSHIQTSSITDITTVTLWFYVESSVINIPKYLLDMRSGGAGGWIYNFGQGSNWSSGTLYFNGGSAQSIIWANIQPYIQQWVNVTVVANTAATDDINLFSRFSDNEGLDVTFGIAMIYNRVLSQEENRKNFEALRGRYGI